MSKKVNNIEDTPVNRIDLKSLSDITKDAFLRFGKYVNTQRHIPSIDDGLKISYRRLLYSVLSYPKGKKVKTIQLLGKVSERHPHSTDGLQGTVAAFVKSDVFEGQGFFGQSYIDGSSDPQAAPRYTEVCLSNNYRDIIGELINDVQYVESPIGPTEPSYIPLPIPLCLCMDSIVSGLGVGINTIIPNFSAKSIYNAFIKNDPNLLEPNIDIEIIKKDSDLDGLWNKGKGRVVYKFHTQDYINADGCRGILISGDCGIFTPKLKHKLIRRWEDEGKIIKEDLTDQSGPKYFIGVVKGIRSLSFEELKEVVESICINKNTYTLNVTDGVSAFRIPLKDWINYTYNRYVNLANVRNQKDINSVEFDIKVFTALPDVANYIINTNPKADDEEISKALNLDSDVVKAIMSKSISNLRKNKDTTQKVKDLNNKLKELKKFDAVKFTDEVISKL